MARHVPRSLTSPGRERSIGTDEAPARSGRRADVGTVIALLLLWLRVAGLAGQSVLLGGVVIGLLYLRRAGGGDDAWRRAARRHLRLIQGGAVAVAAGQLATLALQAADLAEAPGWSLGAMLAAPVYQMAVARTLVALGALAVTWWVGRAPASVLRWAALGGTGLGLAGTAAALSHASARLDGTLGLWAIDTLHQAAAGVWLGGVFHVLILVVRGPASAGEIGWLRGFSRVALGAVTVLALTGMSMAVIYVQSLGAAVGTSYGAMMLTKIAMFAALLVLGGLNFLAIGRKARVRLRYLVEVEAGLALSALFLAASIGSAPPAADVIERATPAELRAVLTPGWPRLTAPSLAELASASALSDPTAPRQAENTAWSEFGHNISGLFIVAMGVLAMLHGTGRFPWARHWPLLLVGLAAFLAWNMDPEGWQTGLVGFWEHMLDPEVLQHRIFLFAIAVFGVAEWRIRARGGPVGWSAYIFPAVCLLSGTLLLAHTHVVSNVKSAFMMELTHLPMGLLILVAGWTRWLELRLPGTESRLPGRLWPPALTVLGLLLVLYREL